MEWRLIFTVADYYEMYDYSVVDWENIILPIKCISAVYCGVRCDKDVIDNLVEISKRSDNLFDVFVMRLSDVTQGIKAVCER